MSLAFSEIGYSKAGSVATILLNRPQSLNALTGQMVEEWASAIEEAQRDDDVRVLVVTGSGRGFCAGADLSWLKTMPEDGVAARRDHIRNTVQRIPRALANFDKPYVAAINGPAMGAGFDNCAMADLRIASDRAKFSINHLRAGALSGDGGYYFLTRMLGIARTLELVLNCDVFDAQEALRVGFVSKVVPHDDLPDTTLELAAKLANGPPIATQLAKRLIYQAWDVSLGQHLDDAMLASVMLQGTEDFSEGPRAILERRPPRFLGK